MGDWKPRDDTSRSNLLTATNMLFFPFHPLSHVHLQNDLSPIFYSGQLQTLHTTSSNSRAL
jgi:hypothetical protein